MKIIVCFMLAMITCIASAQEIEVPKLFVDSTIVTTLKSGKQYTFNGNEWMVVRRKPKVNLAESNSNIAQIDKKELVRLQSSQQKMNRVRVLGGVGPTGFKRETHSNYVEVHNRNGAVGGVGYDRMLNNSISVGGQALTNGTLLLGAGYDF